MDRRDAVEWSGEPCRLPGVSAARDAYVYAVGQYAIVARPSCGLAVVLLNQRAVQLLSDGRAGKTKVSRREQEEWHE